jgi:hypothetical protein
VCTGTPVQYEQTVRWRVQFSSLPSWLMSWMTCTLPAAAPNPPASPFSSYCRASISTSSSGSCAAPRAKQRERYVSVLK